jgi:hypothetical protein
VGIDFYPEPIGPKEVFAAEFDIAQANIDAMPLSDAEKAEAKVQAYEALQKLSRMNEAEKIKLGERVNENTNKGFKWRELNPFRVDDAQAAVPLPIAIASCLTNPACTAALATLSGATIGAFSYAVKKTAEILYTPEHKNEGSTYSTPAQESKMDKEEFPAADQTKTQTPGFESPKYEFKVPGFEIHADKDMTVLYKDDNGNHQSEYWSKSTEFKGNKVYQRDDLIDPNRINPDNMKTSLENMKLGRAPTGSDGLPIILHHLTQNAKGSIAEVTEGFHQKYTKIIHINPSKIESGIDRAEFRKWRESYWKDRAKDFIK